MLLYKYNTPIRKEKGVTFATPLLFLSFRNITDRLPFRHHPIKLS